MSGLNKVMIIGNVGRDPEMRYTPQGQAIATFTVAVSRRWNAPEGGQREETEWFNVVAWDKLAEQCNQLVTKGRKVYVEGRLQTRSWDDKESGQKKYKSEVVANVMTLLDGQARAEVDVDDELPLDEPPAGVQQRRVQVAAAQGAERAAVRQTGRPVPIARNQRWSPAGSADDELPF